MSHIKCVQANSVKKKSLNALHLDVSKNLGSSANKKVSVNCGYDDNQKQCSRVNHNIYIYNHFWSVWFKKLNNY